MGGKKRVGREGDTPGGFTRVIQSRLPVSKRKKRRKKKERERGERKNINQPVKNKRGEKGELYLPPNEPPSFLSPSCLFFLSSSVHSLFHLYPKSLSIAVVPPPHRPSPLHRPPLSSLNFLPPIILSPSVSLRHVFQGPPSIDTVSTNSSPPVPSQEPLGVEGGRGEPGEGLRGEGLLGTW